ncbi:hypothetical protein ACWGI1_10195, partial [Streptomyces sp. NPDC054835]
VTPSWLGVPAPAMTADLKHAYASTPTQRKEKEKEEETRCGNTKERTSVEVRASALSVIDTA